MERPASKGNALLIASGAAIGFAYGLSVRYGSRVFPHSSLFEVMTLGFMVFLPFAMGFITIFVIERRRPQIFGYGFFSLGSPSPLPKRPQRRRCGRV